MPLYGVPFIPEKLMRENVKVVKTCRACLGKKFKLWFGLGIQPLANNLIDNVEIFEEHSFPLGLMVCENCQLVQLTHVVNPDLLFKNYLYYSSTSQVFKDHFLALAKEQFILDKVHKDDLVVDIGSNDGILLAPFKAQGAKVLGIEPAADIANQAVKGGIETIPEYFTLELAGKIRESHGEAKLITATNVFAHVDDLDEILDGVKFLLAPDGRFMIEVAYLPKMIQQGTFDLIYHEHLCYWHLSPLQTLFARKGMYIDEAKIVPVHGGSLRVFARVGIATLKDPRDSGLTKSKEFWDFPKEVEEHKREIVSVLTKYKKQGKRIIGYGAPAKMSTMTNYFDIGSEVIDYIIDDSPAKWNKYSPGQHIKIVEPLKDLSHCTHDFIFIFAWNFAESIIKKCRAAGYKQAFIIPFPRVKIV